MPLPIVAAALVAVPVLASAGKGMKDNDALLLLGGLAALWLFSRASGVVDDVREAVEGAVDKVDILPESREFIEGFTNPVPRREAWEGTWSGGSPNPPTRESFMANPDDPSLWEWEGLGVPNPPVTKAVEVSPAEAYGRSFRQHWSRPWEVDLPGLQPFDVRYRRNWVELDLPGVDPYDIRDIPGDIGGGIKGLGSKIAGWF